MTDIHLHQGKIERIPCPVCGNEASVKKTLNHVIHDSSSRWIHEFEKNGSWQRDWIDINMITEIRCRYCGTLFVGGTAGGDTANGRNTFFVHEEVKND